MKRTLLFFGIIFFCLFHPIDNAFANKGKVRTVVIDPGHGGRDPGAVGSKSEEKDIVLNIGLKLGEYIEENLPDVNVIYTREKDEFVELYRRAEIANKNNADLFISLHCNSNPSKSTHGTETYVMGLHRSQENLAVAKKENAAILYEDDYEETYDGFDPHSPEANIIFSLYQNAYLENSLKIASHIQQQFSERANRVNRGVKQAGFLVLYQITMPGILVEAGFLSNPREEEYLMSETGQAYLASAIFRAFRDYKEEQEKLYAARKNNYTETDENIHSEVIEDKETEIDSNNNQETSISEVINEEVADLEEKNDNKESNEDTYSAKEDETKSAEKPEHSKVNNNEDNITFKVQIATTSEKTPLDAPKFEVLEDVDYYYHEGMYKYTVGNENSLEAAAEIHEELQKAGFKDAFVVAFLNGERIPQSEAIEMLKE